MLKQTARQKIVKASLENLTTDKIKTLQNVADEAKLDTNEVHTAMIANLMVNEKWNIKKADNLLQLSNALHSTQQIRTKNFDRVLRFPSDESLKELKHYLSMA